MGFFNGTTTQSEEQQVIEKALSAGYETNPSAMEGGRALIPEDLESTLTNILSESDTDCKMFASLHKQPVKSTVHEIAARTGLGEYRFSTVAEGGDPVEETQSIERRLFQTKYIATLGKVTKQMEMAETIEGAYESEKLAAVNRVSLAAEHLMFHGNSDVIPTEFDGLEKQIKDFASKSTDIKKNSTVLDLHGLAIGQKSTDSDLTILDAGEAMFDDIAETVFTKGGDLKRIMFPPILSKDFKSIYADKLRVLPNSNGYTLPQLPDIVTSIGSTLKIVGHDAGADKLYRVKGAVIAAGSASLRPSAPASLTVVANASASKSHFFSNDAGVYTYAVHAVNAYGISAATAGDATATVAAGGSVTLTITPPSSGNTPSGYIITRSAPDGSVLMEMVQIAATADAATEYTDLNENLPGTASIVLLSAVESRGRNAISFGQLMPITSVPLPIESNLAKRFTVALYGMLEMRNPEHHALVENIAYSGGLYYSK